MVSGRPAFRGKGCYWQFANRAPIARNLLNLKISIGKALKTVLFLGKRRFPLSE